MTAARFALALVPLALMLSSSVHATACGDPVAQPLPVRSTPVPPVSSSFAGRPVSFASPHVLLAESRDESLALDVVLLRLRSETCSADAYSGYKPRTAFDNTPWRYNMEKGKKFTAEEFDAWMRSRGVRVAKGKTEVAPAVVTPAVAPVDAAQVVKE